MLRQDDLDHLCKDFMIDYLRSVKCDEYLDKEVVPFADSELLEVLLSKMDCMENLLAKVKRENEKSDDGTKYLDYLIENDAEYGLGIYLKLVKKANSIPDYQKGNFIPRITDSIRKVDSSVAAVIDIIAELIIISHSKGFKDCNFGLSSCLGEALYNISRNDNYEIVRDVLERIKSGNSNDNESLFKFCNWHLIRLEKEFKIQSDKPWTIQQLNEMNAENKINAK